MKQTEISEKWKPISEGWLGNNMGVHCHWCKFIHNDDGESSCDNKKSKAYKQRIRTWDGAFAEECHFFELSDWYKSDENYDKTFKKQGA